MSKLVCFPAAFSLEASCSLMILFDFLPFLDVGSYSSIELYVVSSELALALDLVIEPSTDPSEVWAGSFPSVGHPLPSSNASFS